MGSLRAEITVLLVVFLADGFVKEAGSEGGLDVVIGGDSSSGAVLGLGGLSLLRGRGRRGAVRAGVFPFAHCDVDGCVKELRGLNERIWWGKAV